MGSLRDPSVIPLWSLFVLQEQEELHSYRARVLAELEEEKRKLESHIAEIQEGRVRAHCDTLWLVAAMSEGTGFMSSCPSFHCRVNLKVQQTLTPPSRVSVTLLARALVVSILTFNRLSCCPLGILHPRIALLRVTPSLSVSCHQMRGSCVVQSSSTSQ